MYGRLDLLDCYFDFWQPWKAKHLNIQMDSATTSTAVAEVEIDNEHGVQKYNWPVSWVEVGEVQDFLPEAGTAYKYGQSQVCAPK